MPEIVVPDNLRSGVSRVCFYEPDINPTYLVELNGVIRELLEKLNKRPFRKPPCISSVWQNNYAVAEMVDRGA